jgi:hypothetical protein
MDTNEWIRALTADSERRDFPLNGVWWSAFCGAAVLAALAFIILIGPRSDIAQAAETVRFLFKFAVTSALSAIAFLLVVRMSRPGASLAAPLSLIGLVLVLLAGAIGIELLTVSSDQWVERWIGSNALVCLTFISLIGVAPLTVVMAALRYGAPTRPGMAGAAAGLLAGGVAATFYAAHCTDDSPLFVATWYSIAIGLLMIVGFISGRLFVRW